MAEFAQQKGTPVTKFQTRVLKKGDYLLLKALVERYALPNSGDIIEIALRLTYEVLQRSDFDGKAWFLRIAQEVVANQQLDIPSNNKFSLP